jgi:phage terminase large subunit
MQGLTKVYYDSADAYADGKRVVANKGGTRSSKTYSVVQLLLTISLMSSKFISLVSESFPHLRRGVMKDFAEILDK